MLYKIIIDGYMCKTYVMGLKHGVNDDVILNNVVCVVFRYTFNTFWYSLQDTIILL